jgi:hypothetical protein
MFDFGLRMISNFTAGVSSLYLVEGHPYLNRAFDAVSPPSPSSVCSATKAYETHLSMRVEIEKYLAGKAEIF